eukprot:3468718-Amphidinium_carterae.1
MLQVMWNHTRDQASRIDGLEQLLANQYQILRAGTNEAMISLLIESCFATKETFAMMSHDRDAYTSVKHGNRDTAETFLQLSNKVNVMA